MTVMVTVVVTVTCAATTSNKKRVAEGTFANTWRSQICMQSYWDLRCCRSQGGPLLHCSQCSYRLTQISGFGDVLRFVFRFGDCDTGVPWKCSECCNCSLQAEAKHCHRNCHTSCNAEAPCGSRSAVVTVHCFPHPANRATHLARMRSAFPLESKRMRN